MESALDVLFDLDDVDGVFLGYYEVAIQCLLYLFSVDTYDLVDLEEYTETFQRNKDAAQSLLNELHTPVMDRVDSLTAQFRQWKGVLLNRISQMDW